jgi:tetratricopeptide (TPR) repeat protein
MEKYRTAKILFSENKFDTASQYFKDSFNEEVLNENEKIDCLNQIIKIQKILNKTHDSVQVEIDLANFLIQKKEYSSASEVLKNLVEKSENYELSFKLVETLVKQGDLSEAESRAIELFKYLYKKKNNNKTFKLYSYVCSVFPENKKFEAFNLLSLIQVGDFKEVEKKYSSTNNEIIFEAFLSTSFNHWRHSDLYKEVVFSNCLIPGNYVLNKLVIKLTLELLVLSKELKKEWVESLVVFFIKNGRKTVSRLLCNYSESVSLDIDESITFKIDSLPEDVEIETDLDMGEDLFSNGSPLEKYSLDNMIREHELLISLGDDKEASTISSKIRKLSPNHKMFSNEVEGTKLKKKLVTIDDLEDQWSNHTFEKNQQQKSLISKAKMTIIGLRDEDFLNSYKDLVVCFNMMELYEASYQVFERLSSLNNLDDLELDLDSLYLKLKTMIAAKDYFKAYDLVTNINGSLPLQNENRIEFLYLQGEVARKLGRAKDAIKSYMIVKEINPNYRLVKQRLNSFG